MTTQADYIRFAALGDSATLGLDDPVDRGWRGWARLLSDAIATAHQVSFCNLALPGATVSEVREHQLPLALAHRPVIASLVVGLNDAMRSTWDARRIREDLLHCARELAESGAMVITARFHDHGRAIGLPGFLARPLARRIAELNGIYDEVHELYGVLRIDLGPDGAAAHRDFWAHDRLHPSELGHRHVAVRVARLLNAEGLEFELPSLVCTGPRVGRVKGAQVLATEAAPWIARRIRDLTPHAGRLLVRQVRLRW
ncbi:lysophospholipase L1-like esterase [Nocardioides ginsengisegetis]|uniref:Lysophospholipase L1-like esterase n=1 Tax=Nocardioides ginsengisegetis TaxID=661491 RepID=A0A7W3P8J8_9ACTN|nr:SGNH/GDSL hydrolase family protein [Nocardioides ginsengisegetis]MBA8802466.1 lysophospholipase L1-like esterase [Nocardioides ginsengisegetis]